MDKNTHMLLEPFMKENPLDEYMVIETKQINENLIEYMAYYKQQKNLVRIH